MIIFNFFHSLITTMGLHNSKSESFIPQELTIDKNPQQEKNEKERTIKKLNGKRIRPKILGIFSPVNTTHFSHLLSREGLRLTSSMS